MASEILFKIVFFVNSILLAYLIFENKDDLKNIDVKSAKSQTEDSKPYVLLTEGNYDIIFRNIKIIEEPYEKDVDYKLTKTRIIESIPYQRFYKAAKIEENEGLMEKLPNHVPIFSEKSNMVDLHYNLKEYQKIVKNDWVSFNPIAKLGYYKDKPKLKHYNGKPSQEPDFKIPHLGLFNDPNYCHVHDNFVINNPEVILEKMYFLSDYHPLSIPRYFALGQFGTDTSPKVSKDMHQSNYFQRLFSIDPRTSIFYTKFTNIHIYHEIGSHFACWGQSYNHIPGHGAITRKDLVVTSANNYLKKWNKYAQEAKDIENGGQRIEGSALPIGATEADVKKCFNETSFFPTSYRLYDEEECKSYFNILNADNYSELKKESEVQFVLKIGFGVHRGVGVYLIDNETERNLIANYSNGAKCGQMDENLVAQKYFYDPFTVDGGHKFDFRIYMLVVSVDPLIVYYHDGFLRVSLFKYDKHEMNRGAHLTNTEIAKEIFKKIEEEGGTHMGMDANQLREFQMRTLPTFQEYMTKNKIVSDDNWVENKLKFDFKLAFIHLMKMSERILFKNPAVFEIYGVDFLLDDKLNNYFIEVNAGPMQVGTSKKKTAIMKSLNRGIIQITLAYIRSRVKRSLDFLKLHADDIKNDVNLPKLSKEFRNLNRNYLEPEYEHMVQNTSWEIVIDENKKGADAYNGFIKEECVSMMNSD